MLDEQFLVHVFSNIGVPAALCFYTLFEVNKNIKLLNSSVTNLIAEVTRNLNRLADLVDKLDRRIERLEDRILPRHESS